jgi:hypothetical protein
MRVPSIAALTIGISVAIAATHAAPAVAESAAGAVGPDIVKLKNGGLARGTISELVPGDYVVIVGADGKPKRFPMAEVSYAGKADQQGTTPGEPAKMADESGKPSPEITIHAEKARLRFSSTPAGYTLHKQTGSGMAAARGVVAYGVSYTEVCAAPCEATIAAGSHTLALSKPGGPPVPAMPVAIPAGESQVQATYTDRQSTRLTGLWVAAGSLLGGLGLGLYFSDTDWLMWTGLGVALGGMTVGMVMMYTPDQVDFQVAPGGGGTAFERGQQPGRQMTSRFSGLSYRGSF